MKKLVENVFVAIWVMNVEAGADNAANEVSAIDGPVEYTVNGVTFKMIPVAGGTFTMGATGELANMAYEDEKPTHQVTLSDYQLGETEVTQALWEAVMGNNPSYWTGANLPVENISWEDCQSFIEKLNEVTGLGFRLPTEAEWEYGAKGGSKAQGCLYSGSNDIEKAAWYSENCEDKTHPVGAKSPNELGLYDMTGNVCEFCSDWCGEYSNNAATNPQGPSTGTHRVYRGGSIYTLDPNECRVSSRNGALSDSRNSDFGLRLAR